MSYAPPSGDAADFTWEGASPYEIPAGHAADFSWQAPPDPSQGNPGDLLFWQDRAADGDLIFGLTPDDQTVASPVSIDATFPDLVVEFVALSPVDVGIDAAFPDLEVEVDVAYASNTERPVVGRTTHSWQKAQQTAFGVSEGHQDVAKQQTPWATGHHPAAPLQGRTFFPMPDKIVRLRTGVAHRHQDAAREQRQTGFRHQEEVQVRVRKESRFQDAIGLGRVARLPHQEAILVRSSRHSSWQQIVSVLLGRRAGDSYGPARPLVFGRGSAYETAVVPPPGLTVYVPPTKPTPPSCYEPHPDLLFSFPQLFAPDLLFQCGHYEPEVPPPEGEVVVPIRRVYIVINNTYFRRVLDDAVVPCLEAGLTLDTDSWTWGLSATLPAQALEQVLPVNGQNIELKALVNGTEFRFIVESVEREWVFGQRAVRIAGRGKNAYLDAPYAPTMSFTNQFARTARQLMDDVLTANGVSLGWNVDWQLDDWDVPANVFAHQGTYISALGTIAMAAGGFILPHPSAQSMTIKHRYPVKPWELETATPNFVLPAAVTTREGLRWVDKPRYNRVFVSGQQAGIEGRVTRAGTAGELLAPGVTDPLITDVEAARQRGLAILGDTGRQVFVGLRLPVLPETGVLRPGHIVRYVEGSTTRTGIVRSVSLEIRHPTVFQTLEVETHEQ